MRRKGNAMREKRSQKVRINKQGGSRKKERAKQRKLENTLDRDEKRMSGEVRKASENEGEEKEEAFRRETIS